jgi:hypothetical protein
LQIGFDWTDFHLHRFRIRKTHLRQFRGHFDWFYSVRVRENLKM